MSTCASIAVFSALSFWKPKFGSFHQFEHTSGWNVRIEELENQETAAKNECGEEGFVVLAQAALGFLHSVSLEGKTT